MIGSCDNCDRQNVPVFNGTASGMETTQCYLCNGETDPDPYGEQDTAEIQIERRLDFIVREMDEILAMAANPETVDLIRANKIAVGQIMSRAQIAASFLLIPPAHLRIVQNG